jgi:hypothetical protein
MRILVCLLPDIGRKLDSRSGEVARAAQTGRGSVPCGQEDFRLEATSDEASSGLLANEGLEGCLLQADCRTSELGAGHSEASSRQVNDAAESTRLTHHDAVLQCSSGEEHGRPSCKPSQPP